MPETTEARRDRGAPLPQVSVVPLHPDHNGLVRVITTHLSADFDAFAAAVVAVRLYPDARVLFPGSQEAAVRRFLAETGWPFPEVKLREARRQRWEHAVVVDTRNPARLGEAWELIRRESCPLTLIDHHLNEPEALGAAEVLERPVGATCTVLALVMQERGLAPSADEASLLLMGIYEDTGALSYRDTTPDDLRAAAWLLEHGGSLEWVRQWVQRGLEPNQFELLHRLAEGTEMVTLHGVPVAVSRVDVDRYHEEAAYVVHRWMETFDLTVAVAMLVRGRTTTVILRSRLDGLDVGAVAQLFAGGGHATAASARVTGRVPVELREELLSALAHAMPPETCALDVAVRKIFTVAVGTSVADAKERLNHLRVNALPVEDPERGELIGVVTRQILDRALSHRLDERPVETVMQPEVPSVPADTPLGELRDLFLERSFRFVVVEAGGRPVGLVTRMELFRRLFAHQHETGSGLDNRMASARAVTQPIASRLRELAPKWVCPVLESVPEVAAEHRVTVYLVGGMVRDLLLGRTSEDVDLVVEGDGIAFAEALAERHGGRCHPHAPFLTAVLTLSDGHRVDVASARTEFYRTPAALPDVETSLIRQDLYRRDFTINALAVVLAGARYGELVDFFGGRKDLQRRELRVLHSLSFIDDPTRAIRAVRYARRLGFTIAPDTRDLIATAIREGVFERLSGQRLARELELLLAEPHPAQSLALLAEIGLLGAISSELHWGRDLAAFTLELEGQLAWYVLEGLGPAPEATRLFLGALVVDAGSAAAARLAERLQLAGEAERSFIALSEEVSAMRRAAAVEPRSARVRAVEGGSAEAQLLAMTGLELDARRRLADAVAAAVRVRQPVRGMALRAAGVPEGPWLGEALRATRDALVDGTIDETDAFAHAVGLARRALAARPGSGR